MKSADWIAQAATQLQMITPNPRLEAQVLAMTASNCDKAYIIAHPEAEIPALATELLARRLQNEPLSYIRGWVEFCGHKFAVNSSVLIPRQDTETLVDLASEQTPKGAKVLDLCTGSGCVGISLKLNRSDLEVFASDISEPALEVARSNAKSLFTSLEFRLGDLLEPWPKLEFNTIVCNPPYIANSEELEPQVANFEPPLALFSGDSGLEFYERLAKEATNHLVEGGVIWLELGYSQSSTVEGIFHDSNWKNIQLFKDLSGIQRVLAATRP